MLDFRIKMSLLDLESLYLMPIVSPSSDTEAVLVERESEARLIEPLVLPKYLINKQGCDVGTIFFNHCWHHVAFMTTLVESVKNNVIQRLPS